MDERKSMTCPIIIDLVCMQACLYVCVCVHACICVYVYLSVRVYPSVSVCLSVRVCVCVYKYSNRLLPKSFFRRVFIGALHRKWFGKSSPKEKKENIMVKFIFKVFWGVLGHFWGVGVVRFFSKFRIQSRMILVNSVPNPNLLTQSVGKISHRENP